MKNKIQGTVVLLSSHSRILYIYGPCCREIWRFAYPKNLPERNMTSEGEQRFISSYNKGHKLFIIPKLHTQQNIFFYTNLTFHSICVVVYVDGYHGSMWQQDTWYLFPWSTQSRDTWSFVFLTCDIF